MSGAYMPLRVYHYARCSTCRKALKFLAAGNIPFEMVDIALEPPGIDDLRRMLAVQGGRVRKLFNTSGQVYRSMNLRERLPGMPDGEALALLAGNGMLIKRPFVLTEKGGLLGFRPEEWEAVFGE